MRGSAAMSRIEGAQIATEEPANDDRIRTIDGHWASLHDPRLKGDWQRSWLILLGKELRLAGVGHQSRCAGEYMPIALREQHHIARM
jgi:hypothetical protein